MGEEWKQEKKIRVMTNEKEKNYGATMNNSFGHVLSVLLHAFTEHRSHLQSKVTFLMYIHRKGDKTCMTVPFMGQLQ